jgi:hypothetical protein
MADRTFTLNDAALRAVCDYLNTNLMEFHQGAPHVKWHVDPGKLVTALETATRAVDDDMKIFLVSATCHYTLTVKARTKQDALDNLPPYGEWSQEWADTTAQRIFRGNR